MKSVKKRFKLGLADIESSAAELALLCADLTLLEDMQNLAAEILAAVTSLKQACGEFNKQEFCEGIADSEAWQVLEDMIDADALSLLEERMFNGLGDHADSEAGIFLQQTLDKIGKRYTQIITTIQELSALIASEGD
ncbi:MAG: hypothetical protein ABSB19_15990 [Methylomonas sp.]|jgi:hypothetical protein